MIWLLLACTKASDATDSGADSDPLIADCAASDAPVSDGLWAFGIAEAQKNECESPEGEGYHIHVGEDTVMDFLSDGSCLAATSDPGSDQEMPWTGQQTGDQVEMDGTLTFDQGTCILRVNAHISGTLVDEDTIDYTMTTEFVTEDELSPDACQIFPWPIPCEQQWTGTGVRQ
ncbi:MAG: hypothetical protein GY913_03090 [Proteobacteria bacterium]|nr:hypothetical protein [Pseudomonadota bacterium]MCP4915885.1 hypothetical protein [Pseudomonadota bacterium]